MDTHNDNKIDAVQAGTELKKAWDKPEITDFEPVAAARGIWYRPGDGISNLT
jgi:hypothetical protein